MRAEGVLMQSDNRRLAGGIIDGDDIEPAGALGDVALRKEMLGGSSQYVLFAWRDA